VRGLETGPLEATQADEVAGVWRADERDDDGEALTTAAAELLLADGLEPRGHYERFGMQARRSFTRYSKRLAHAPAGNRSS
jgi:hypothetical protein